MAKICLIDDDVDFAENIADTLRAEGHTVASLPSTEGAIRFLLHEDPDLLVLDLMFPDDTVGGLELARKVRRTPAIRELPIIMLTAVNQEFPTELSADTIDDRWLPVQDFVDKSSSLAALPQRVQTVLSRSQHPGRRSQHPSGF